MQNPGQARTWRARQSAHLTSCRALATALLALALLAGGLACDDEEQEPLGPGEVTQIEILGVSGGSLTLAAGASQEVTVGALDSRGNDVHDAVLTGSSSDESVATVTSRDEAAASHIRLAHAGFRIDALAPGTATVSFREEESGVSAGLAVTVTAP